MNTMPIVEFLNARLDEDEQAALSGELPERTQAEWENNLPSARTRALWMIDARRKILGEYLAGDERAGRIVAVFASSYSDHPDYDERWAEK